MTSGKRHAIISKVTCFVVWMMVAIMKWEPHWTGLFCTWLWSSCFAKSPDLDQDYKIWWGHRSPLYHTAVVPLVASLVVGLLQLEFIPIVVAYWDVARGTHLMADMFGKPSNHITPGVLIASAIVMFGLAFWLLAAFA